MVNLEYYKEIYEEELGEDRKRKVLGFSSKFEYPVYIKIQPIINNDEDSKNTTKSISEKLKKETGIVGWKTKTSSSWKTKSFILLPRYQYFIEHPIQFLYLWP